MPRPVACSGVNLQIEATIAALAVVFEMPISPGIITLNPNFAHSFAIFIPSSIAVIACSLDIAGPSDELSVP